MPVELLVILGAEASLLGFVVAMNLHAKRMDVLSRRSFEPPIVSPWGNRHLARSRDLLRLTRRWGELITFVPPDFLRRADSIRMLRRILQARPPMSVRFEMRTRWTGTLAPGACDRPALLSGAGRNTDAQGKGAGREYMQSSAAAILHQVSAP